MCFPCTMCGSCTDGVDVGEKGVCQECGAVLHVEDIVCPQCFAFRGVARPVDDDSTDLDPSNTGILNS